MIGYNVSKINELLAVLAKNYSLIGEKMAEGWAPLSSTMEKEWIGTDEVSYETELAKNICELYANCTETVTQMINSVKVLGENWASFQANNILNNEGVAITPNSHIEVPALNAYDIASIVKAGTPVFEVGTNMGLANGVASGTTIKTQFDSYINDVYTNVQALYSNLEGAVSSAFLGSELNVKLNDFLKTIGEGLAKLTTCHKSIYDALDTLIQNYATHESQEAAEVSGVTDSGINFNGENLK